MAGNGETAKVENKPTPRSKQSSAERSGRGRWTARSGRAAVNAMERRICGDAAVREVPMAEGLALAGRRAATLLDSEPSAHGPGVGPVVAVPVVHHRVSRLGNRAGPGTAFELVAAAPQQAVDHCLIAHRIASRSGFPGTCTVDPELAESLWLVRLPEVGALPEAATPTGRADRSRVAEIADEAFAEVERQVARPCRAIVEHRLDGARKVLVAVGIDGRRAIRLVDALRASGAAVGALVPTLVRPFPVARIAALLRDREAVVAIEPAGSALAGVEIAAELRGALDRDVRAIRAAGDASSWSEQVCRALGLEPPPAVADDDGPSVVIGVAPGGAWSDEFLLDAAARLAESGPWRLARLRATTSAVAALRIGRHLADPQLEPTVDLLLAVDPGALDADVLGTVRPRGTLLLDGRGSAEDFWSALPEALRADIVERGLRLRRVDLDPSSAGLADRPEVLRTILQGALLGGDGMLRLLRVEPTEIESAADEEVQWLNEGARAVQDLDPAALEQAIDRRELDFGTAIDEPTMPAQVTDETAALWRERLRGFHLTGRGAHSAAEPAPAVGLRPVSAARLAAGDPEWRHYPLLASEERASNGDGSLSTLFSRVEEGLEGLAVDGAAATLSGMHPDRIAAAAGAILRERDEPAPLGEILPSLEARLGAKLDLSEAATEKLRDEIRRLSERLAGPDVAVGFSERTLAELYAYAVRCERAPRRDGFRSEVDSLVVRLEELLRVDDAHGPEGTSADKLKAGLGGPADALFDSDALSKRLPARRGSVRMAPARRERVEQSLNVLKRGLAQVDRDAEMIVVHSGPLARHWRRTAARTVEHPDALEAALGLLAGVAQSRVDLFRAVRVARLEAQGAYDETRHDPVLARFTWESFTDDEYLLLPPVVVLATGRRLRGRSIHSLSRLLRAGLPVHVLVADRVTDLDLDVGGQEKTAHEPGLGYVAMAHREAFVLQSSLAEPRHLFDGLTRMASTLRPAVALVAHPEWTAPLAPWLQLVAARDGRATPCFRYDPEAGPTWADRFDLAGNPEPERAWPAAETGYLDADGNRQAWRRPFTFVDAAACDPGCRRHFRVIPAEAWSDEQLEIESYIDADEPGRGVPFIWVVGPEAMLARAVVTRELAFAGRDRMRAWQILQELAGTNNEYARRAAERAREETLDEARRSREELEAAHAAELERVRAAAAGEAMERLVGVLMDVDAFPATEPRPAAAPAPPPPGAAAPEVADEVLTEAAAEPEEEISFDEPYIDAALCTTCQECLNINSKMFQYNGNKQAFVADAAAGTFEQLVRAAEKCPARCIHPGVPRADDGTASEELIARAARFN